MFSKSINSTHPSQNQLIFKFKLTIIILLICLIFSVVTASAQESARLIRATLSSNIGAIVSDPISNTIYAADNGNNRLLIINAESEVVSSIKIGTPIVDIAISKNTAGYLALATSNAIYIIDFSTDISRVAPRKIAGSGWVEGKRISSVAFDAYNNLFVTISKGLNSASVNNALRIDFKTGEVIETLNNYYSGAVARTDSTGTVLYIGGQPFPEVINNTGIEIIDRYAVGRYKSTPKRTPTTFCKFIDDFSVSPVSDEILVACHYTKSLQLLDGTSLKQTAEYRADSYYAASVTISNNHILYGSATDFVSARKLYEFDPQALSTKITNLAALVVAGSSVPTIPLQQGGIAVSKDGSKVFVVVRTNGANTPAKAGIEVINTGKLICQ